MAKELLPTDGFARILASMAFLAVLSGCLVGGSGGHRTQVQTTLAFEDDYDFYPTYETYYSRNRHEYVYLVDNVWVRRPEPRGVSVSVFLAAPSVRLDFRDAPEHHHRTVIQRYPRTWRSPERNHVQQPPQPAIRTERREVAPPPPARNRNTPRDRDVHPTGKQKREPDPKANRRDNRKDKDRDQDDRRDNKQDDRRDDDKGPK